MRGILVFCLLTTSAGADTSAPAPVRSSRPWFERCAERLEAKRIEWGKSDRAFAMAFVRVSKVNDNRDQVGFHMMSGPTTPGFWISVYDQPVHPRAEKDMEGAAGWAPMVRTPPLGYPVLLRHVHPRSARMQAERWASRLEWQAFVDAWRPLVDACLRD